MTITAERPGTDFAAARRAMIDSQLRTSGVNDPAVLEAFARVAREDHVPAAAQAHAYIDRAIPLGDGHALAAPLFHGRMLVEAGLRSDDTVLLVSCGSGYLAALLEGLVAALGGEMDWGAQTGAQVAETPAAPTREAALAEAADPPF